MGLAFYIGPTVGAKCSRQLTWVVFMRGSSSRARAPSFYSVREYLKRSEQRGTLAAVCTLAIKSASEKHQKVTHLRLETPCLDAVKVVENT